MKKVAVIVTCLMTLAGSAVADTSEDVAAWYGEYAKLWKTADVDVDAVARYYAIPSYEVDENGVVHLMSTAEAVQATQAAFINSAKQQGWAGGKVLSVKAHVLNPGAAFVESEWMNYGADGKPLQACEAGRFTYVAVKTTNGWKFVSAHDGPCKAR